MIKDARITVNLDDIVGRIDPKIYGQFIEHFHRCVYGGIYEEGSKFSDKAGYRLDVLAALKRIHVPILRWPGGCYADGYHWYRGIGPKEQRPITYDLAWRVDENNRFGTDEFIEYCRCLGAEPYINVNVGSGTPEEAANWVEYCNRKGNSYYAGFRREYGHSEPYRVTYWGIGNEIGMWGEIGTLTVEEYVKELRRYVKLMKRVDPRIKVIGVGFERDPDWNVELLHNAGDLVDYISTHAYHYREVPDYYVSVGSASLTDNWLKHLVNVVQAAETITAKPFEISERKRHIEIAFDEYNAWGWSHPSPNAEITEEEFTNVFLGNDRNELYTLREAIFTARYIHMFHRFCNKVTLATFSPTINVRGMIFTHKDGIILRPYYHVFDLYVNHSGNVAIHSEVETETFNIQTTMRREAISVKDIPYLDVSATLNESERKLYVAVINLHKDSDIKCKINLERCRVKCKADVWELNGENVETYNDIDHPEDVKVVAKHSVTADTRFNYEFPAHSVTILGMDIEG